MLKELIKAWKDDSLQKALNKTKEMLDNSEEMYKASTALMFRGQEPKFDIYEKDKTINNGEIDVKKRVLEHLTINPKQNTVSFFRLIEIAKAIERIGDNSKNIFELKRFYPKEKGMDKSKYLNDLKIAHMALLKMFELTKTAFNNSDKKIAEKVVKMHIGEVAPKINKLIDSIAEDKKIEAKDVVAYILFARFMKRIGARLKNICDGVINPLE